MSRASSRIITTILALHMAAACAWASTVWHVNDDAPNDPGPNDALVSDPLEDGSVAHPFDSIQEAVALAVASDTVLIAPGTYHEAVDFLGKDITVTSSDGPEVTIVDLEDAFSSVFSLINGESRAAILNGLTITRGGGTSNGSARVGGGVRIADSSPTISNNRIISNKAHFGGGIDTERGNPLIINNLIAQNSADDAHRHISGDGGGVSVYDSAAVLLGNTIINNSAHRLGAGLGVNGTFGTFTIEVLCANNLLAGNSSPGSGGGVGIVGRGTLIVRGCTISGNTAVAGSGFFSAGADISATLANTILFGNAGPQAKVRLGALTTVGYCDVAGGLSGFFIENGSPVIWGTGNIQADPIFSNASGGDWRLTPCSPCVNAADPAYVPSPGETDLQGGLRVFGPRLDIGANELVYVDCNDNDRPDACEVNPGCDTNCDGSLNLFDIQPFVHAISTQSGCSPCAGDANGDGSLNQFDIQPFIECLTP